MYPILVTLVEGPTDAVFTMQLPVPTALGAPDIIYESCSFGSNQNGQAICVISASGSGLFISGVQTDTDEVTPITVMGNAGSGGSAPAPTPTTGNGSGSTSPSA